MNNKTLRTDLDNNKSRMKMIAPTIMLLLFNFNMLLGQSPGGVAGVSLWYDPFTGVTVSGGTVSRWNNRGAFNNVNLLNASSGTRPTLNNSNADSNYNPYLSFGTNDNLRTTTQIPNGITNHTTFLVTKIGAGGGINIMKSIIYF